MKKTNDRSRRRFLGGSILLSGFAMGASHASLAATGLNSQDNGSKVIRKAPLFDPTLENYPGYSAYIPVPEFKEPEEEQDDSLFAGL